MLWKAWRARPEKELSMRTIQVFPSSGTDKEGLPSAYPVRQKRVELWETTEKENV